MIEMELDHDTGEHGRAVLAGPFAGGALDELDEARFAQLYAECRQRRPGRRCGS